MLKTLITTALCLGIISCATAQNETRQLEEMHVDMPDETEETDLIEKGQIQLETSVLYNRYATLPNSIIGQAMLRYGVHKRIEVRLLMEDGKNRDTYIEKTVQSTAPMAIGAKVALLKDHCWLPDMTLVSYVKLPFTSRSKEQKNYWSPIFLLAFQNKVGEKLKIEYNAGIQQEAYSANWMWLANTSVHYKITDPFEVFVEYYAQFQQQELPVHNAGIGFAWQLNNTLEVYAATGSSIASENTNSFASGGIAIRLPKAANTSK